MVSVLAAAEGENGALLGLARGMIIPLVKDDLSMLGASLFVTSVAQEEKVAPPPPPQAAKPRIPSKQSPLRKIPSSSTLLSVAARDNAPERSSSQPPQSRVNRSTPPSRPSKALTEKRGLASSGGARLPAKGPPQKALPIGVTKRSESVDGAAKAESFLANLRSGGLVGKEDGTDLVFTFSDDSEDEASAGESLQSEMERVRQQLQKLEGGRNVREGSVPAEESESRSNGGRPESGGGNPGPLSRFAGRLGPLKGSLAVGGKGLVVSVIGGQKPGPNTKIVAKAVSVETALEEMRRKVASMEQEMKQTSKGGRPATPPVGQKRKAVAQPVGVKEENKRPAGGSPQKVATGGGAPGVFARLGEVKAAPGGVVSPKTVVGVSNSSKGGVGEKGSESLPRAPQKKQTVLPQKGQGVDDGSRTGVGMVELERGNPNPKSKHKPDEPQGPVAVPAAKPSTTLMSQTGMKELRSANVPAPLKEPLEGKGAAESGRASPPKRKASPADVSRPPLKQPKLEKELTGVALQAAPDGATAAPLGPRSPSKPISTPQGITSGEPAPSVPKTLAPVPAELSAAAGALVPLELGVTSAEPGATSAERQLAALAQEEERCWAGLREGEAEAAEWGRNREELQRALSEAEKAEREARERVLVMREKLEANRRLRVELELRDRMEKRLRQVRGRGQRDGGTDAQEKRLGAGNGGLRIEDGVRQAVEAREGLAEGLAEVLVVAASGAGPGIATGGDGAVWTHEEHEGGYVVSQLEEREPRAEPANHVSGLPEKAGVSGGVSEVVSRDEGAASRGAIVSVKELTADRRGAHGAARRHASPEAAGTYAALPSGAGETKQREVPGGLAVGDPVTVASVPEFERDIADGRKAPGGAISGETAHGEGATERRSSSADLRGGRDVGAPDRVGEQAPGAGAPGQKGGLSKGLMESPVDLAGTDLPQPIGGESPEGSAFLVVSSSEARKGEREGGSQGGAEGLRVQAIAAGMHVFVESAQPAAESGARLGQVAEKGARAGGQEVGRKRPPESDGKAPVRYRVEADGHLPKRLRGEEKEGPSEADGENGLAAKETTARNDPALTADVLSEPLPESIPALASSASLEVEPTPIEASTSTSPHHSSFEVRGASPKCGSEPAPKSVNPSMPDTPSSSKAPQSAEALNLDPRQNLKPLDAPKPPNPLQERLATLLAETAPPGGAFTGALTAFRSFRLTPQYGTVWGRKLESLTWSNAVLPNWPLCATEVLSGRCSEKGCEYQHARDYVLKEKGLLAQLRGYGAATDTLRGKDTENKVTTLEERAAQVVQQTWRKGITAPFLVEPALKKWNEAPIPIYRVGNYLMDHRERPLPSGRGFSTPRAVASPVLSPGLVRPVTAGMPFIGELEREDDGTAPSTWRYWERVEAVENGDGNESWEEALQRALDIVDNNLETRNTEKLDQALAILARALEGNRQVPCLWAVYLELFIRRAKDDQEAVEMMEAAVRFNPSSYALWVFYLNTRTTLEGKLRICQRACSSITSSLTTRVKEDSDPVNLSAALLDLTLRQPHLHSESGDHQAVIAEVQSLLAQATADAPSHETQVENAGRVFLSGLTPSDSVVLWVSCAHLLAYGVLPNCTSSRLGFAQVLVSPEETWLDQSRLELIRGSEVAVLHVFQIAANEFSFRASESKGGSEEATHAWRLGLQSLASHSVSVTGLILGVDQALAVCDQLLEVYPGHTDLAYRRATMLLRTTPVSGQNGRPEKKSDGEVSEALKSLLPIAESLNGTESATEAEGDQYLAVLRCAELLREWTSDEAALRFLQRTLHGSPKDCVEALCCCALKASLEGDQLQANELAKSLEALAQSREHVRLVAEQRATFAADVTSDVALAALTSLLPRGSGGARWPALELRPLAPPWDDVTSEGLREQLRHAWWNKTAWDYSLVNHVISAWLPEIKSLLNGRGGEVSPERVQELVAALEHLLRCTPGNVALSLASGKLGLKSSSDGPAIRAELFESWSIPLVFEALVLAQPRAESGLWDELAKRCREAGEERAAEELRLGGEGCNGRTTGSLRAYGMKGRFQSEMVLDELLKIGCRQSFLEPLKKEIKHPRSNGKANKRNHDGPLRQGVVRSSKGYRAGAATRYH
ncbi:hypothetical protein KFL_001230090 [Klebsormidium nitens]|uniref:Zinc-finger domain-containing protein n=1 Tax=Klebsormidium nitens TaxID=105231 RepID=A0A1Y1I0T5_KLENI|nr:hypothetical protein KFL_001230090 [Klebsormidium nitens]|eukprot:GAQ82761.1 hypothetical protein KFL_001230090 [Klebsormidium nitens]